LRHSNPSVSASLSVPPHNAHSSCKVVQKLRPKLWDLHSGWHLAKPLVLSEVSLSSTPKPWPRDPHATSHFAGGTHAQESSLEPNGVERDVKSSNANRDGDEPH